ncbi:MAG TPA: GPW/gp25 family protein [Candidatus Cybelea sp.]|nr:GPW/gp25 family protein [Candidatus Cybelea sp.]
MNVRYPYGFDSSGHTAQCADTDHIDQMLEQLLFTNPGERVMQPNFGSGVMQLVFAPNSPQLAATVEYTMQGAIQQYLGDIIALQQLTVTAEDSTLTIDIGYIVRSTGQSASLTLTQGS